MVESIRTLVNILGDEKMKSICCSEALVINYQEELYHGSDDEYELVIPFLVCTGCGEIQIVRQNKIINDTSGGEKNERNFNNTYYKEG